MHGIGVQIYWGGKETHQEFISSFHQNYQTNTNVLLGHKSSFIFGILGLNFMIVEPFCIKIWNDIQNYPRM